VQKRRAEKIQKATASDATFEAVARDLHATKKSGWSEVHAKHWLRAMEKDLFPWLGSLALPDVTAPILLHALRKIEARGAINTAHDAREFSGQVFMYGIATGRCERNVAADLRGALKPLAVKHMGALTEPKKVGDLLRAIAGYQGQPITRAALQLASLLFQRPGNVRSMEWAELDLEAAMWSIPAAKMKRRLDGKRNGRPHLVPLSTQAVAILNDELRPLTGHGRYVFPSLLSGERPMSDNTLNTALRRLGFSRDDMMVEKLGIDEAVIEAALAHAKSGPLKGAYDRTEFMDQRRVAAQRWADYLDALRAGGKVVKMKTA
jgi:integrase